MQARQLVLKTFILSSDTNQDIGILIMGDNVTLLCKDSLTTYSTLEELESTLGKVEFKYNEDSKEVTKLYIDGYPIKHLSYYNVKHTDSYITYTVTEHSNIKYVAGYVGVSLSDSYMHMILLSVKESTFLNVTNNCIGPFKTSEECQSLAKSKWMTRNGNESVSEVISQSKSGKGKRFKGNKIDN
jgi:hypothetical protein